MPSHLEWARDGDTLDRPCLRSKNRLSCKDVTGPYGYPEVALTCCWE